MNQHHYLGIYASIINFTGFKGLLNNKLNFISDYSEMNFISKKILSSAVAELFIFWSINLNLTKIGLLRFAKGLGIFPYKIKVP